ncbi:hypothetical protein BLA29_004009, partial [Euroglyphus maynei]
LCVGPTPRRRNHHQQYFANSPTPSIPIQNIAKHLNFLLYNGLSWQPSFDTNIPKFRSHRYLPTWIFAENFMLDRFMANIIIY